MRHPIEVGDFRTTGMSPQHDVRATEIATVRLESDRVAGPYQSLRKTGAWIPTVIPQLTDITNAMSHPLLGPQTVSRRLRRSLPDEWLAPKVHSREGCGPLASQTGAARPSIQIHRTDGAGVARGHATRRLVALDACRRTALSRVSHSQRLPITGQAQRESETSP